MEIVSWSNHVHIFRVTFFLQLNEWNGRIYTLHYTGEIVHIFNFKKSSEFDGFKKQCTELVRRNLPNSWIDAGTNGDSNQNCFSLNRAIIFYVD